MAKWIILVVIAVIAAAAWADSPYCADNDIEASKQIYAECMKNTFASPPMCSRAAVQTACKRWARW